MVLRAYREQVIEMLVRAVIEDEFDDEEQNEQVYGGQIPWEEDFIDFCRRNIKGEKILEIGCGSGRSFEILPITHAIEPNPARLKKAIERGREKGIEVRQGFAECIPFTDAYFDTVIAWNVWCFLRSEDEASIEVNRVLKKGGHFIFNVAEYSDLPLVKTCNPRCLVNRMRLFGFELVEIRKMGVLHGEVKYAICLEKVRDFDYRYLMLPQVRGGKILNYLPDRDWWLR